MRPTWRTAAGIAFFGAGLALGIIFSRCAAADGPATEPSVSISIANDSFKCTRGDFSCGVDQQTVHEGRAAVLLSTQVTQSERADASYDVDLKPFLGKRVRFSAYLKSEKVSNKAGIWLHAVDDSRNNLAIADTFWQPIEGEADRSLAGDNDWKKFQLVADIPAEVTHLSVGMALNSAGKVWMDDARLEVVPDDTPTTDDQNLHQWSLYPAAYTLAADQAEQRDGHPTTRIKSNFARSDSEFEYGRYNRHADMLAGHRLHLSVWIKTEGVVGAPQLQIFGIGAGDKYAEIDEHANPAPPAGSSDWKKYEVYASVPANAHSVYYLVDWTGQGTIWVDGFGVEDTTDPAVSP